NAFTEDLINRVQQEFREDYWGFLMLGGMSGGGMAFIINPDIRENFKSRVYEIMHELKEVYQFSLPFIVNPVVYDFDFNHNGIVSRLLKGDDVSLPQTRLDHMNKESPEQEHQNENDVSSIKTRYGFDADSHENMKAMLKNGEIGLTKNHLPQDTLIQDVSHNEILHVKDVQQNHTLSRLGLESLKKKEISVVTFSGGLGSRWSNGAAVVKPVNPFIKMAGKYRTFIEVHLAKSRKTSTLSGGEIPHVFTTSYLTHNAIESYLRRFNYFNYGNDIFLSPAKSIGHRVYPMERDLRFYWDEQLQQKEEENVQKMQDNIHHALIEWVKMRGQGEDYSENTPILRFNPPGHWYEIPNLIKNGVLARLLRTYPNLKYLFCHNIDTMGAHIDPSLLELHIVNRSCITFEVTPRRIDDRGGGLAKVNGHMQIIEGLALPRKEDEYKFSYYNSLTNWITIDSLLDFFGLARDVILDSDRKDSSRDRVVEAIRKIEQRIPTYVTIKNVKHLWGRGQEDVYPVAQFEKLWGDMSGLRDLAVQYVAVSRYRGQQLKEPAQLYTWVQDGSFEYLKSKAAF
ncbi:MAG: UTP--glucose-1-phosphate uridylyltransferase, partial [Nitrospiraceae bacterium]